MSETIGALFTGVGLGGMFGLIIGVAITGAEDHTDIEETCKETSRLLSDMESVERKNTAFEYARVNGGKCVISINTPFDTDGPKVYDLAGAQSRIDALLKKHGVPQ